MDFPLIFRVLWVVLKKTWLKRYIKLPLFMCVCKYTLCVFRYLNKRVRRISAYSSFITQFKIEFLLLFAGCRKVLGKMPGFYFSRYLSIFTTFQNLIQNVLKKTFVANFPFKIHSNPHPLNYQNLLSMMKTFCRCSFKWIEQWWWMTS